MPRQAAQVRLKQFSKQGILLALKTHAGADLENLCREAVMTGLREDIHMPALEDCHMRTSLEELRRRLQASR
jgi:SpoVK/Ycf46/Vps4 family AAA+-type ATPase